MGRKSAEVNKVTQWINEDLLTELEQHPSQIRRWFTDNFLQRALAYLVALTEEKKAVTLRCTADGKLKVVSGGAGFTEYNVFDGSALDTYDSTTTYTFNGAYSRIDILVEDNDAIVSFLKENSTWGADMIMKTGYHSIDFECYGVRIKNRTAGYTANYEIVVYR